MQEHQLLQHIYQTAAASGKQRNVELGPGDDCCIIRSGNTRLLLSTDQLIAGRHYDDSATTDQIARKAIARSLSDIAAMAGEPTATLAAACLPPNYPNAQELFDRVHHWGAHFGAPVVGGDIATSQGHAILTITAIGRVPDGAKPIFRSGAKPGDSIYVTGKLGGSFKSGRHLSFEPRIKEALHLARTLGPNLRAMIDLSDGLGRDAYRIAQASDADLLIDQLALPIHDDSDWRGAVSDGEDYELLFTVDPAEELPPCCPETGTAYTRIGPVQNVTGAIAGKRQPPKCNLLLADDDVIDISKMGWDHGGES